MQIKKAVFSRNLKLRATSGLKLVSFERSGAGLAARVHDRLVIASFEANCDPSKYGICSLPHFYLTFLRINLSSSSSPYIS